MTIACGTARRILWPDAGPREASQQVIEAREHMSHCAACNAFFAEMNAISAALLHTAGDIVAPLEVRERLFSAIAEARTRQRFSRRMIHAVIAITAVAVLLLGAALVVHQFTSPSSEQALIAAIVTDHGQWLRRGGINSAAQNDVSRWLAARVPYAVDVPSFPEGRLKGARITTIEGRLAAVVEYDIGGRPLSYFVVQMGGSADAERVTRVMHARREGYETVLWREPGLTHVLVGRISPATLDEMAMMCIEQNRKVSSLAHGRKLEA